jgi:hypothetical protein
METQRSAEPAPVVEVVPTQRQPLERMAVLVELLAVVVEVVVVA